MWCMETCLNNFGRIQKDILPTLTWLVIWIIGDFHIILFQTIDILMFTYAPKMCTILWPRSGYQLVLSTYGNKVGGGWDVDGRIKICHHSLNVEKNITFGFGDFFHSVFLLCMSHMCMWCFIGEPSLAWYFVCALVFAKESFLVQCFFLSQHL